MSEKSLKALNRPKVALVLAVDMLCVWYLATNSNILDSLGASIARSSLASPFAALFAFILGSLLPVSWKSAIVFWRIKEALPGHRAFTERMLADPRIESAKLFEKIGDPPTVASEQNSKWYALYRENAGETSVVDSHMNYLLFRELTVLSALATAFVFLTGWGLAVHLAGWLFSSSILAIQYVVFMICARNNADQFVRNVLACVSSKS